MPFLVLNDLPVLVQIVPVEAEVQLFGDHGRAYDGTMLTRWRARKRQWRCKTIWLVPAAAEPLLAVIRGAQPVVASGDLPGSTLQTITDFVGMRTMTFPGPVRRWRLVFTVREV